jgi:hypothetical protein
MLTANIDYDEHKGRIAIGRVYNGTIKRGQQVRRGARRLAPLRWRPGPGPRLPHAARRASQPSARGVIARTGHHHC